MSIGIAPAGFRVAPPALALPGSLADNGAEWRRRAVAAAPAEGDNGAMPGTILLVEDNPDDAELTRLALDRVRSASKVVHLTDGAQALEYLHGPARAPDLRFVILDVKLPKVDGLQVLARLRAEPSTRSIPVVILSSSNREGEIARCYELGVNSYVVKPVELDEYMDRISALGRYWDQINHPGAAG